MTTETSTATVDDSSPDAQLSKLTDKLYRELGRFVQSRYSIRLTPEKKFMVEGRLRKRLPKYSFKSLNEYVIWTLSEDGEEEQIHLVDTLTTNKTDFFREPKHFDYLSKTLVPQFLKAGIGVDVPLHLWSAACSSGAEPYTLSMVLNEWQRLNSRFQFHITASDISVSMLQKANRARYTIEEIAGIPQLYRQHYLLRHKSNQGIIKIDRKVRSSVNFKMINLSADNYDIQRPLHLVMCRNVLIYFDKECKKDIVSRFYRNLSPKGILMIGHSETINDVNVPFKQLAPTIYQRA